MTHEKDDIVRSLHRNDISPKNRDGVLGKPCNYCGGFGFTANITGGSTGCNRCHGDGIEPVDTRALKKQVDDLTAMVKLIDRNVKRLLTPQ